MREAGLEVRLHKEYFAEDERDEVWLPDVAQRGWIILTRDKRIRRRPIEKQALIASGAKAFVLTATDLTGQEMADILVKQINRIERIARKTGPLVAAISRTTVTMLKL